MPELPEVERARRIAESALVGRTIASVSVADDRIIFEGLGPSAVARRLRGRAVLAAKRWGKYFWLELDERPWPVLHLGMTGNLVPFDKPGDRPRFWKLVVTTDAGDRLAYTNARRFGRVRFIDDPLHARPIAKLGFDPLIDLPRADRLAATLAKRKAPIKAVLLDQSFAAGVGNWIADEVLYQAGIAPRRPASDLSREEVARIRQQLRAVIRKAVGADADKRRFPKHWLFHRRWGRKAESVTAAGEAIVHETIGGRTTAWVPARQS